MISNSRILLMPKIEDDRGNLSFIEGGKHIPFTIRRVYWVYDVPGGETRSGHAYHDLHEVFVSLSGSFDVVLDDGKQKETVSLNRSYFGLYVPNMVWRHLENFSTNSVCMVLASQPYNEGHYIRDYGLYLEALHASARCPQ